MQGFSSVVVPLVLPVSTVLSSYTDFFSSKGGTGTAVLSVSEDTLIFTGGEQLNRYYYILKVSFFFFF